MSDTKSRIPFDAGADFYWLTAHALKVARGNEPHLWCHLLQTPEGIMPGPGMHWAASPATVEAIADLVAGVSEQEREDWILLAESIGLSERHADWRGCVVNAAMCRH